MEGTFCGANETCITLIYTLGVGMIGWVMGSRGMTGNEEERSVWPK